MSRIPVLLLTGFLGSGKTTILNRLVADPDFSDTAIVINEAGLVGIDHLLVAEGEEDVVLLDGGCLCCRMRGSLPSALGALLRRARPDGTLPFRRVVVETSGLADPGPILQGLISDGGFGRRFTLAGVVTVIDARHFEASLAEHPEVTMQAVLADRLLVTKTDLVGPEHGRRLAARLMQLNPEAGQVVVPHGVVLPRAFWTEALALADGPRRRSGVCADDGSPSGFATVAESWPGRISADDLDGWLDHTMALFGPSLLRLKALIHLPNRERPVVLHGVQGLLHGQGEMTREGPDGLNRMVLIGHRVDEASLRDAIVGLTELTQA